MKIIITIVVLVLLLVSNGYGAILRGKVTLQNSGFQLIKRYRSKRWVKKQIPQLLPTAVNSNWSLMIRIPAKVLLYIYKDGYERFFIFYYSHWVYPPRLSGLVTDEEGRFISGAKVVVKDIETHTNTNGWFSLEIPPEKQEEKLLVTIQKSGYKNKLEYVYPGNKTNLVLVLENETGKK